MKKYIFSVIAAIFIFTCATYAQTTVSISEVKSFENLEVLVPITSDKPLSGIGSLTFKIQYDESVLDFNDEIINNALSGEGTFLIDHNSGEISIGWFSAVPVSITDTIMVLKFGYKSGTSDLTLLEKEITDKDGVQFPGLTFVDGKVGPYAVELKLGSIVSAVGDTVLVPLSAVNLQNIGSLTLYVNYDDTKVDFLGVANDSVGFTTNATGNVITMGWFDAINPLTVMMDKLTDLKFVIKGGLSNLTFDAASEVTNMSGTVLNPVYTNGLVSDYANQPAVLSLADIRGTAGTQVSFAVTGKGINNLGSATLKVTYNPAVLEYTGYENLVSGQISDNSVAGVLTIGYFNTSGLTVGDGKIVDLLFNYIGGSSAVAWDKTFGEITDVSGNPLVVAFADGSIVGNSAPVFVDVLPDSTIKGGETLAFAYSATDADGDVLTFAKVSGPEELTVDSVGALNWNIPIATSGVFEVVTSVSDGMATVLDTAVVTVQVGAYVVTIKQIQQPTDTTDVSPYVNMIVKTTGIVTAIDSVSSGGMGYYLQDGAGAWNGILVYTNKAKPTVKQGDKVTVTTIVNEYYNYTELNYDKQPIGLEIVSSGNALPAVTKIKTGDDKEAYEGVLVKYSLAEVTEGVVSFGQWKADDGSGVAVIDDMMYAYTPTVGDMLEITGIINYTYSIYALQPRYEADITASPAQLITWFNLEAGSAKYLDPADLNTRGVAYNPTTGHVLVASRTGVPRIYVLDGITGAYLDTLDATGLAEVGQYKVNQVVVAEDGAIYSCTMAAWGFATNEFRVHRWADEDAVPTVAYSAVGTTRNGDVLAVSGSGVNTVLYSSGSGSMELRKFTTTDGSTFTLTNTINLAGSYAGGGISPVSDSPDANLWVKKGGEPVRLIDQTGAVLATISTDLIPIYHWDVDYVQLADGTELIAVAGGNSNPGSLEMQVVDVTDLNNPKQVYYGIKTGTFNPNANATGAVDIREFDANQFRVYHLLTNNGLALYANYEAPTYDMELLSLDHVGGDLTVTMFNDGNIGYHDTGIGKGIEWKGVNGLWKGAIVYGRTSAEYAVGNAHNNNSVEFADMVNVESYFNKGFTTWKNFDQVTYPVVLTDGDAPQPYGLPVIQQSFSKSDENTVFIKYSFINNTGAAITDLYAGMFLDIDVGPGNSYNTNKGGYSEAEKLVYEYHDANNAYYGAAAITDGDWGARVTTSNAAADVFRKTALTYISELPATWDESPAGDQRTWIGAPVRGRGNDGTTSIAVGDTGSVVFALVAGDDLIGIRTNADYAFRTAKAVGWTTFSTDVTTDLNVPSDFSLSQNYPNPFNPATTIKFGLPSASQVKVKVFNILGETVDVLVNQDMAAGFHSISWNASNLSSGIYFYSIEAKSNEGGKSFSVTKKMMLLK